MKINSRALTIGGFITAVLLADAVTANAQETSAGQRAEKLFNEATALVERRDYAAACPKFEESLRLDPALGTQYNLALCYEKVGRLGSAWRNFQEVERLAHATGKKNREDAAHQKLGELRPLVSHLVLAAADADANITVDGTGAPRDTWAFYAVDAGQHTVTAEAPAKKSWSTRVTVPSTAGAELRVTAPALEIAKGQTQVVTVTTERSTPKRTIGFVVGGIGIVASGAAAVTSVMVMNAKSTADDKCQPRCVDQDGRDAVARGKTLIPINLAAWVVGAVGLGAGAFLVLTARSRASEQAVRIVPYVGASDGGAALSGSF